MPGMGFLTCNIQIGGKDYKQQLIVCKQLAPGIILGRDFLCKNQLGITWGPEGVLQLRDNQDILVYRDKGTPPKKEGGSSFTVTKLPLSLEPMGQRPLSLPHFP